MFDITKGMPASPLYAPDQFLNSFDYNLRPSAAQILSQTDARAVTPKLRESKFNSKNSKRISELSEMIHNQRVNSQPTSVKSPRFISNRIKPS